MGSLNRFELEKYREQYDLATFFETGTFHGNGVQNPLDAKFETIISAEIVDEYADNARLKFEDFDNVNIHAGSSISILEKYLPETEGNILFWLDAHFPGADGGLTDYNAEGNESIRLPLLPELEIIKKHRRGREDVFLIDDLRIYETGEYARGNLPSNIIPPTEAGIEFIHRLFGETHHIIRLLYDEGYVVLLPIDKIPKLYVRRTLDEFPVLQGGIDA